MQYGEIIALSVAGFAALFSGLSGFFLWRNGTPQIASDAISAYQARVDQLKENAEELKKRVLICEDLHRKNLEETGRQAGVIEVLERNLQNRNPESQEFMKLMTRAAVDSEKYMQQSLSILQGVKEFFASLQTGKYAIVRNTPQE